MRFYAFMRTTVEFPPDLLRQAKIQAAARGESLKSLLTRAVAAELGRVAGMAPRRRLALPLIGDPKAPPVRVTGADLAKALADQEAARAVLQDGRR